MNVLLLDQEQRLTMEQCQAEPHEEHMQFMSLHCGHHMSGVSSPGLGTGASLHHCLLILWNWGKGIDEEGS